MNAISIIGFVVAIAGGFAVAAGILYVAARLTAEYGMHTWNNLTGIYKMEVMRYWFKRMDAEGTHIVRKSYEENRATKEA